MLVRDIPFKQIRNPRQLIAEFQNNLSLPIPETAPKILSQIIKQATQSDIALRPEMKQIVYALTKSASEEVSMFFCIFFKKLKF